MKINNGKDLLAKARQHLGEEYVYGAVVDLDDPNWTGPWDCAEFITWTVKQVTGKTYGVTEDGEPWTGAWLADINRGRVIPVDRYKARNIPGAIMLRRAGGRGHIAFSDGRGGTIEAKGTRWGVCRDTSDPDERDFNYAILIPGVEYEGA